jgi:Isochorismatase family
LKLLNMWVAETALVNLEVVRPGAQEIAGNKDNRYSHRSLPGKPQTSDERYAHTPPSTMLLDPASSSLVIVDVNVGSATTTSTVVDHLTIALSAAGLATVPILLTHSDGPGTGAISTLLSIAPFSLPSHPLDTHVKTWSSSSLGRALSKAGKTQIIICGAWLEEGVTGLALRAYSLGLEVFLLTDAVAARNSNAHDVHMARLVQAGIVPTTVDQMILEWAAMTTDANLRTQLRNSIPAVTVGSP